LKTEIANLCILYIVYESLIYSFNLFEGNFYSNSSILISVVFTFGNLYVLYKNYKLDNNCYLFNS